tara:strand:- start:422 stop:649 length:228 start_codon:yes stop_codon:yes gene_type:complete
MSLTRTNKDRICTKCGGDILKGDFRELHPDRESECLICVGQRRSDDIIEIERKKAFKLMLWASIVIALMFGVPYG